MGKYVRHPTFLLDNHMENPYRNNVTAVSEMFAGPRVYAAFKDADFQDVPRARLHISQAGSAPVLSEQDRDFLVQVAIAANRKLTYGSLLLDDGDENQYLTRLVNPRETIPLMDRTVEAVYEIAGGNRYMQVVCPPAGATPLARLLHDTYFFPGHRIHSPEINGSSGTNTGEATLKTGHLASELTNSFNPLVFLEDVIDSGNTMLEVARMRNKERDPLEYNEAWWKNLARRIKEAHDDHLADPLLYETYVRTIAQERIYVVPLISKNPHMLAALRELVFKNDDPRFSDWRAIQQSFMRLAPIKEIEPDKWILGLGLDTGIKFSRMAKEQPGLRELLPVYVLDDQNQWIVRAGATTVGINYLRTMEQERHIVRLLADTAMELRRGIIQPRS